MGDPVQTFDMEDLQSYLAYKKTLSKAQAADSRWNKPFDFVKFGPIALDVEQKNPLSLPAPFKSLIVKAASDKDATVALWVNSDNEANRLSAYPLVLSDSLAWDDTVGAAYITWAAQAGKTISIWFSLNGKVSTAQQISSTAGGVSISDGSTPSDFSVTLANGDNVVIVADLNRKLLEFENTGAGTMWLQVLNPTTQAIGRRIPPGATYEWRDTGSLRCWYDGVDAPTIYGFVHK